MMTTDYDTVGVSLQIARIRGVGKGSHVSIHSWR